jgi:hypothetical protein
MQRGNQIWGGVARSIANGGGGGGLGGGSFDSFMKGLKEYNDKQDMAANQQRRTVNSMLDDARSGFNRSVDTVSGKLKLLGEGSDGALNALKGLAKGSFLGSIVGQLVDYGTSMLDNYRKMNDAGQGFVGGMQDMGKAAAAGGVTMGELVRVTQKNSAAMSQLGGPSGFLGLATGVRRNLQDFNMLGMTVSQINDYIGDYTETMRVQGRLEMTSRVAAAEQISKLATNASILSQAFGTSREEILKQTAASQRDAGVVSYRETLSDDMKRKFDEMMNYVTPQFAALGGEAGQFLTKLTTQVAGHMDNPGMIQSGPAKDMMDHGMTDMVFHLRDLMEQAMKSPTESNKKALADYRVLLGNTMSQLAPALRLMDSTGQQLASMGPAMERVITAKQQEDARNIALMADSRAKLTAAAASFEDLWLRATGDIRLKMYGMMESGMTAVMKGFESFRGSGGLQKLEQALSGAASSIFKLFGATFSGNFAQDVATATESLLKGITKAANGIGWLADKLESHGGTILAVVGGLMGLKLAFGALGLIGGGSGVFGILASALSSLVGILGAPALAAIAAGIGAMTLVARSGLNEDEGPHRAKLDQIRQQMNMLEGELSRAQGAGNQSKINELQGRIEALKQERAAENAYLEKILADKQAASLASQRQSIQQDIVRLESVSENLRNQNAIDAQKNALRNVNDALDIANKRADAAQQATNEAMGRAQQQRTIRQVESYEAGLPRDTGASAIVGSNQMLGNQLAALNTVMGGVLRGLSTEEQVFILQKELVNLTKRRDAGGGAPVDPALTREMESVSNVLRYLGGAVERNTSATQQESRTNAIGGDIGQQVAGAVERVSAATPVTQAVGDVGSRIDGVADEINATRSVLAQNIGSLAQSMENRRSDARSQFDGQMAAIIGLKKEVRDAGVRTAQSGGE